jgi:hypothetical protein
MALLVAGNLLLRAKGLLRRARTGGASLFSKLPSKEVHRVAVMPSLTELSAHQIAFFSQRQHASIFGFDALI